MDATCLLLSGQAPITYSVTEKTVPYVINGCVDKTQVQRYRTRVNNKADYKPKVSDRFLVVSLLHTHSHNFFKKQNIQHCILLRGNTSLLIIKYPTPFIIYLSQPPNAFFSFSFLVHQFSSPRFSFLRCQKYAFFFLQEETNLLYSIIS